MHFKKHFLLSLAFTPLILGCVNTTIKATPAPEVEPRLLRMGHQAEVEIKTPTADQIEHVTLLPGTPFQIDSAQLSVTPVTFTVVDNIAWLASTENRVTAISLAPEQFGKTLQQLVTNKIIALDASRQFLAIAQNNMSIELYSSDTKQSTLLQTFALSAPITDLALHQHSLCVSLADSSLAHINFTAMNAVKIHLTRTPFIFQKISFDGHTCSGSHEQQGIASFELNNDNNDWTTIGQYQNNGTVYDIQHSDIGITLANGDAGFTLLQSEDHQLHWQGSYNKLGNITHLSTDNAKTLVADDTGILSLIDLTYPDNPRLSLDYGVSEKIYDLYLKEDIATVLTDKKILRIDFSGHGTPPISNFGVNLGGSRRAFVEGDIIYVADWFSGLHLYDISIPQTPRLISSYHTPGSPKGVVVRDGVAYVADDDHGLQVVDVRDPLNPFFISELPLEGLAYTMKLSGDLLYIASHRGGLHIVDVSNPRNTRLVGTFDTPGKSWAVALKGKHAYVADDDNGLLIFDISRPSAPTVVGQFSPGGHAEDIVIVNNLAYVSFFENGLFVLDISNATRPNLVSHLATPGNARGIAIDNNKLYLASWNAGLHVIDISKPATPKIISQYDTQGSAWGVNVAGSYAYVLDWWGGLKIFDLSQSSLPALAGKYQTSGVVESLQKQGNYIFTAQGTRGLQIFDAKNTLNPVWATAVELEGYASDVAVKDSYAYVASSTSGIAVVDISNPFQAHWKRQIPFSDSIDRLVLTDHFLITGSKEGGLNVIDISNPLAPKKLTRFNLFVRDLAVSGKHIFIATKGDGIATLDVNNLTISAFSRTNAQLIASNSQHLYALNTQNQLIEMDPYTGKKQRALTLESTADGLKATENALYTSVSQRKLLAIDVSAGKFQKLAEYPTTRRINRMVIEDDAIFFAGEPTISSAELLPDIQISSRNKEKLVITIPAAMPTGSYHLRLNLNNGEEHLIHNAFEVGFVKPKKPKFTMEDLKRKMQQSDLKGKTP